MSRIKIPAALILVFLGWSSFATHKDSLLISELRQFIIGESQFKFSDHFYTTWSKTNKPYINLYVSAGDKVESATKYKFTGLGTNEEEARERAAKHEAKGRHAFIYKTYATSSAELNDRFISYSQESKCFIVLHEFIHHYRRDLDLAIPYEFEEALGDVVGNYGAMEFIQRHEASNSKSIRKQTSRNERIYKIINSTTDIINRKPGRANKLNLKCQKRIEHILANSDEFQKDRFGYKVNNAYLLKNRFYSEKYFVLKRLFQKTGTLKDFLNIIKKGPPDPKEFDAYLKSFL